MKLLKFRKKYVAGALAAGLIMGAGGIAAAYFSATGSGTGAALVGHATPFVITPGPAMGHLYPGGSQTVYFDLKNVGTGPQHWTILAGNPSTQITLYTTGAGNILTAKTGAKVPGCKVHWFTVSTSAQSGTIPAKGIENSAFDATVSMTNGTGTLGSTQNACQTKSPKLAVSFSRILRADATISS